MDAPARRPSVLLVEDDARAGNMLARLLRDDGFDVEVAVDGAYAIARLAQAPLPDVLMTDLNLPRVDGVTVLRFARTRRAGLPVIVVTGYPQLLAGTPDPLVPPPTVLTKPVDYLDLARELRRACA